MFFFHLCNLNISIQFILFITLPSASIVKQIYKDKVPFLSQGSTRQFFFFITPKHLPHEHRETQSKFLIFVLSRAAAEQRQKNQERKKQKQNVARLHTCFPPKLFVERKIMLWKRQKETQTHQTRVYICLKIRERVYEFYILHIFSNSIFFPMCIMMLHSKLYFSLNQLLPPVTLSALHFITFHTTLGCLCHFKVNINWNEPVKETSLNADVISRKWLSVRHKGVN